MSVGPPVIPIARAAAPDSPRRAAPRRHRRASRRSEEVQIQVLETVRGVADQQKLGILVDPRLQVFQILVHARRRAAVAAALALDPSEPDRGGWPERGVAALGIEALWECTLLGKWESGDESP